MRPAVTRIVRALLAGTLVLLLLASAFLAWTALSDATNGRLMSSGVMRRYLLRVPRNYDRSKPAPLVISFHPAATWPALEQAISHWDDVADEHGFLVVYPAGTGLFGGRLARGPHVFLLGADNRAGEARFISDLIDRLETDYNIDRDRIYANGMSNGGAMAFAVSCDLSDRIAAVGVVAGAIPEDLACGTPTPRALIAFHGTADRLAPYAGGSSPAAPRPFTSIPNWIGGIARRNGCAREPDAAQPSPDVRRLAYGSCRDDADVLLYTIDAGGHTWPGGRHLPAWAVGRTTDDIDATRLMWSFFAGHPRAR